jgi:hypothetical protein
LKNADSPYRMRGKNLLPKFGSERNPFAHTTKPAADEPPTAAPAVKPEGALPKVAASGAVVALKDTKRLPMAKDQFKKTRRLPVVAAGTVAQPAKPGVEWWGAVWNAVSGFMKKLNFPAWWPRGRSAAKFGKPVVQTELSLEKIKPVRNDLNEADLEVVTAKAAEARPKPAPAERKAVQPELVPVNAT